MACFQRTCESLGDRMVAKAMDDRIGCAVLLQVMRELGACPHDLSFVFTVQEEVGLRGAVTSGYGAEPDIALAVDVTLTGDTPECPPMAVELGAGPAIKIKDGGMLTHIGVKEWLLAKAGGAGIPFQREVLVTGTTDASAIQTTRSGVPGGLRVDSHPLRAHALGNGGLSRRAGSCEAPRRRPLGTHRHRSIRWIARMRLPGHRSLDTRIFTSIVEESPTSVIITTPGGISSTSTASSRP